MTHTRANFLFVITRITTQQLLIFFMIFICLLSFLNALRHWDLQKPTFDMFVNRRDILVRFAAIAHASNARFFLLRFECVAILRSIRHAVSAL